MHGIDDRKMKAARLLREQPTSCPICWGSGKLANDDEQSPWPVWDCLEGPSRMSVMMGLVRPFPCPRCGGTGTQRETPAAPSAAP